MANFWNPHLNAPNTMPHNRHRIFEKVPNCAEMPRIYQRSHAFSFSVVKGHGIFNILSWQVILENGHFTHWLQQNGHFTQWLISLSQWVICPSVFFLTLKSRIITPPISFQCLSHIFVILVPRRIRSCCWPLRSNLYWHGAVLLCPVSYTGTTCT